MDEPSAYLDSEQRIAAAKVIKRFIMHSKKTAFIVEHDFIMATYLADRLVRLTPSYTERCSLACSVRPVQSDRLRRSSWRGNHCALSAGPDSGHECVPEAARHLLPQRPHQLPAAHQQDGFHQGQGAEANRQLLLPGYG